MTEKTHWLQSPNKNYLGHWDLPSGKDIVVTIQSAKWEEVKNPITNKSEAKRVVRFVEKVKPMICNQTNAQTILTAIGVKFMEDSTGKKIQLFVDSIKDKRSKEMIDCIRVRGKITIQDKEILSETHPKWKAACENLKSGAVKIETLRQHFEISDATLTKMQK